MKIKEGERLPASEFFYLDNNNAVRTVDTSTLLKGHKAIMFAVPGAFTPTCSAKHLPGYFRLYDQMIAKGVSSIGCMAVNDPHVMKAWGDVSGVDGKIDMLSDSDCSISKSLGLDMNFGKVLGHRSKRFAMIVDNKVITHLFVEEVGAFEVSTAENILESL